MPTPTGAPPRPDHPPAGSASQASLFPHLPPAGEVIASDGVEYRPGELAPVWLQRINLFIQVMFCLYLGAVVAVLPWWPNVWVRNPYLLVHPQLWHFLMLGPVRGVISGLGLLDIWIGLSEAIHYRDVRAPQPPRK